MFQRKPVVVVEEGLVRAELLALGLTPEIVRSIAIAASAAKVDTLAVDPVSTPGTFSYIYGVRNTRLQLLPMGWKVSRVGNVESTVNHELGIQLCFQNVDLACAEQDPSAISGKGSGSRNLILRGKQGELFEKGESPTATAIGTTPTVWVICFSSDGKNLRAEVSCPEIFEGEQYEGFSKRIFVVDESLDPKPGSNFKPDSDGDASEYEVKISRK